MTIPFIAFLLATATACLTLAINVHKGEILKTAPGWVELSLFAIAGVLYTLGGILAVRHWLRERRKELIPSPPSPQAISQQANPHQEQHVHIGSDVLRTPPSSPPIRQPKPCPKLELIDHKSTMIGYDSRWREVNPSDVAPDRWKANAFVAIFRNKPAPLGQETASARYAIARLIYRNEKGEQQIVDYGTWLGKYEHSADFQSGKSRALVLSSKVRAGTLKDDGAYVFDNQNRSNIFKAPYHSSGKVINAPAEKPLLRECSEVEITIVSENVTLYHGKFQRVEAIDGEMTWAPVDPG
jgi:hypothetical protein